MTRLSGNGFPQSFCTFSSYRLRDCGREWHILTRALTQLWTTYSKNWYLYGENILTKMVYRVYA